MGYGAAWGDYDNDEDFDLYLANWGVNRLFRNDNGLFWHYWRKIGQFHSVLYPRFSSHPSIRNDSYKENDGLCEMLWSDLVSRCILRVLNNTQ